MPKLDTKQTDLQKSTEELLCLSPSFRKESKHLQTRFLVVVLQLLKESLSGGAERNLREAGKQSVCSAAGDHEQPRAWTKLPLGSRFSQHPVSSETTTKQTEESATPTRFLCRFSSIVLIIVLQGLISSWSHSLKI